MTNNIYTEEQRKAALDILYGADKDLRKALVEDHFLFFLTYYYEPYIKFDFADFHYDMFRDIQAFTTYELDISVWEMFRESAKSSIGRAFLMWMILFKKINFAVIAAYNKQNAENHLVSIIQELESNQRILEDFGQLFHSDLKKQQAGTKKKRMDNFETNNGVYVIAVSTQQSPRGFLSPKGDRPDFILADDFETEVTKDSPIMTQDVIDFFSTLIAGKSAGAFILALCNGIAPNGSVSYLKGIAGNSNKGKVRSIAILDSKQQATWPSKYAVTDEEADSRNEATALALKAEGLPMDPDMIISSIETKKRQLGREFGPEFMNISTDPTEMVFNLDMVTKDMEEAPEPNYPLSAVPEYQQFERPELGAAYSIGGDIAQGVGADSSATCNMKSKGHLAVVVATYMNNTITAPEFAQIYMNQGIEYHYALLSPEANNDGYGVVPTLVEKYPRDKIFREKVEDKVKRTMSMRYGWYNAGLKKKDIITSFADAYNRGEIIINDLRLLDQMSKYTYTLLNMNSRESKNASRKGVGHFDLLLAAAIAYKSLPNARPVYGNKGNQVQIKKHVKWSGGRY